MSKYIIELNENTFAILQNFSLKENNIIVARIGFIKPGLKCLEYVHLTNWEPIFKGRTKSINDWLKIMYQKNAAKIKRRIVSITPNIIQN